MRQIDGKAKTIRALLGGAKYAIDYYQREYKWETKQVEELITDLTGKFLEDYSEVHERPEVQQYGHYFLGSIITSEKESRKFIIDGQQRLTTLTLLLIYIYHQLKSDRDKAQVAELVFSEQYGMMSFNLDIEERRPALEALFHNASFDETGHPEAVQNIMGRYKDIEELFPNDLLDPALPYFKDWLIENVHLVEIIAFSDEDAYTIFETMNDRGLSLKPADMLKGFLLANISDEARKFEANRIWKSRINQLKELGKDEDADCLKSWLRSQYAHSIRERKRGAIPEDFDRLGTEFHRWVRENKEQIGLNCSSDFVQFIERNYDFYSRQYIRIQLAAKKLTPRLESIFYNAQNKFTLQYPLLLASLKPEDRETIIERKLKLVADYIDILIARRIWNFRAVDYSTMQYAMFLVMRDIRGQEYESLARILCGKLDAEEEIFSSNDRFRLHGTNRRQIQYLLARITDYVEVQSGHNSRFDEYISGFGRKGYEVEHIWANHPERHEDEFEHPADFAEYRNRIGDLLLLPKSFNASYGDMPYEEKLPHYNTQNLLARSLHPQAYDHNPAFLRFVQESGLPFRAHETFTRADLDSRHVLYPQLAEIIWSPSRLRQETLVKETSIEVSHKR